MGVIGKKPKIIPSVPTSSMADIAFLLLVFFMTTTIFKHEEGLDVNLPRAEAAKKQKSENLANIWVDKDGRISINDKMVFLSDIGPIMAKKLEENPAILVSFKADNRVKYEIINLVQEELKAVNAVRVNFSSDLEKGR
jgi:biopolymer transport protein ExbD